MRRKILPAIIAVFGLLLLFPVCRLVDISGPELPVSSFTIYGLKAPQAGEKPGRVLEADQYRGTVEWVPPVEDVILAGREYAAVISLKPKAGYSLSSVPRNSFQVPGAYRVTNAAGSKRLHL